MLSQLERLSRAADGRYATDEELQFIDDYMKTYSLRLQTYQRLQDVEAEIVQRVYAKMRSIDPNLFMNGSEDISAKWKRDTILVLRYSAVALLLNDPDTLCERLLFWLQTVMKAFGAQRSCRITYEVMQDVVKQQLSPPQASLFCSILEVNCRLLGIS
ncbi:phycobilisome protein [Leptolyngbya sp. FACHB-36]|uniref:phycobilisome protein n=1 Tax=Leptolyngbya sp. FACHB-36 TaxID=2692808 RepID=UPI00168140D1|nr:phycobilisome protein [Leptolyngbya sp. FACHB-36]MBD2019815.1 phycobilisome protein [Leptolyngbya sp. FACHB-36]